MINVCFDIGNVLCQFDIMKFVNKLAEVAKISEHDAWFFLDHLQKMQDIGITTVAHGLEYRFRLSKEDLNLLVDTWNKTLTPNDMMLKFLDNLRSHEVKIALLSNMGPEHIAHLRSVCPKMFNQTIQHISCEVGARKPQKLFFQSFCLDNDQFIKSNETINTDTDFSGSLYVDDIEENLKVGKKYGFKVYKFNLDETLKLSKSKQKIELDKMRDAIYSLA